MLDFVGIVIVKELIFVVFGVYVERLVICKMLLIYIL